MDQGSSSNNSFDFNSQAGVMSLLASIRASALSPAEKNELRDLVFLYTNGGGDMSVRIALEQKLVAHKITQAPGKQVVVATPTLSFGSSRPAPVFKTPVMQSAPTPVAPTPTPAPAPVAVPVAPTPEPVVQAVPVPAPAVVVPAPVAAPAPAPVTPVVVQPAPVVPAPEPVAQQPAPVVTPGVNYLDRIREIKTAVNSKVGNPVNLVDINNEVGREYMNALLEAMKRLSGGATGQMEAAMARLETAYKAVEVAVAAHVPDAPVAATPTPVIEQAAPVSPAPLPSMPEEKPVYVPPNAPVDLAAIAAGPSGFDAVPAEPVMQSAPLPEAPAPAPSFASIATEKKPLTPQDFPAASSIASSVTGDPLKTKEIDDGLEQLLSDWVLFKKSGLFGTGPKGREHPLFKKLADLQIPLLLAGRFEGSTQEIKQSITDYMNGWRYEQGIIYETGETFEHYLRRVIKQILDLQKKRRPA